MSSLFSGFSFVFSRVFFSVLSPSHVFCCASLCEMHVCSSFISSRISSCDPYLFFLPSVIFTLAFDVLLFFSFHFLSILVFLYCFFVLFFYYFHFVFIVDFFYFGSLSLSLSLSFSLSLSLSLSLSPSFGIIFFLFVSSFSLHDFSLSCQSFFIFSGYIFLNSFLSCFTFHTVFFF